LGKDGGANGPGDIKMRRNNDLFTKHLLESCNLHSVLDCPGGTFQGAGVKTVVLFFEKGTKTRKVWYYQLDPGRNLGKTNPLNDADLAEFVQLQATCADSPKSWTVDAKSIDPATFDLSVKNPNGGEVVVHRSPEEIMDEMDSAEKTEVQELLEFEEDTAGGMMTTEYVALHDNATAADALAALKGNTDLLESLNTLFLIDTEERLTAAIPLARLFLATGDARLKALASGTLIQVTVDETQKRVTALFDKYNLLTLPVVDEEGKLAGVITADDIISVLRRK